MDGWKVADEDGSLGKAHRASEQGEEREERDEGEQRLPKSGVYADKPVIGEGEREAKIQRAVERCTGESTTARERESERGHGRDEQRSRQQEAQACSPRRSELPIAETHADGVAPGQHRAGHERGERGSFPADTHSGTLRR